MSPGAPQPPRSGIAQLPEGGTLPEATHEGSLARETELKLTLASAEHYELLLRALPPPCRVVSQRNLFLDTADLALSNRRWALRLRLERDERTASEAALLALKGPSHRLGGASHRVDVEHEVDPALWYRVQVNGHIDLAALTGPAAVHARTLLRPGASLLVRLSFENQRKVHRLLLAGVERELVLDRTGFTSGEVDHEIELELALPAAFDDPASLLLVAAVRRELEALLGAAGVTAVPSPKGKLSRALAYAERR